MKSKLNQILDDLMHGRLSAGQLSGGLYLLQFKPGDADNPDCRLCAYRVGVPVGAVELGTLRRELEALLPGVNIKLDGEQTIQGKDEQVRHYRVFRWTATPPTQLELLPLGAPGGAPGARQYTED